MWLCPRAGGCSQNVEAGGEAVGLCMSCSPLMGGRVTRCRVSEDLRRSRATSNPSVSPGGSTFKTHAESAPFSPPPLPPTGPSRPCCLPGCQGPHFCPGRPQPLLSLGGTGTLPLNIHGGPCPHSVQNHPGLHGPQTPSYLTTLLSQVHCNHCAPTSLLPLTLLCHAPVQVSRVGRKQDAMLNRAVRNDFRVSQRDPQRKRVPD